MATSPLTTALKPNVSAGDEADQKYQQALDELMQRLDSRKNRLFDPTLLAAAQGFLTPGQTGSFGEALGNVAQKVGAAEAQQSKEDIDLAQMRLQVAQGAREQASRLKGQEAFRGLIGGQQPAVGGAPSRAAMEAGQSTAGAPPTAAGEPSVAPGASQGQSITMEQALAFAAAYPEQKEMAKLLADAAKFNSDRYKVAMNGTVFDTVTGTYIAQIPPGQTASDYLVPDAGGTVMMTPSQFADYQEARKKGQGKQWVNKFFETEPGKPGDILTREELSRRAEERKQTPSDYLVPELGGKVSMTPAEYQKYLKAREEGKVQDWISKFRAPATAKGPAKPLTEAEIAAEAAGKKTESESVAKADADRYNNAIAKGDDAGSRIGLYKRITASAEQKDAGKILGVFEQGGFGDAVLQYLEANNGLISVKNIRDIWTNLGLDAKLIADKQVLLSLIAQSQFDFRSLAKGQGAISDMETKLFNSMGADISDRPEAVVRKMRMLERRAEFDREVSRMARSARKQGISYDDMKDTEGYRTAYDAYMNDLMKYVSGESRNQIPSAPSAPRAAPGTTPGAPAPLPPVTNPAAARLRRDLGIAQ